MSVSENPDTQQEEITRAVREASSGWAEAMRAHKMAPPDAGFAGRLSGLAEALLRGPSSLSSAERELIATYVSSRNECHFCTQSHAAAARVHYGDERSVVDQVLANAAAAP